MRFDLEINVVSSLSKNGLKAITDTFYSDLNIVKPVNWDTIAPIGTLAKSGGFNTSNFYNFKTVTDTVLSSGVKNMTTANVLDVIYKQGGICPIFSGGDLVFYKYLYRWSNNNTVKKSEFDSTHNYYKCTLDSDTDLGSVNVVTLKMAYPGYVGHNKVYTYVPYDKITVDRVLKADLPSYDQPWKLFIVTDTREIYGTRASNDVIKLLDVTTFSDDVESVILNPNEVVCEISRNKIYKYDGNYLIDIVAREVLKTSSDDYKFTVDTDKDGNQFALIPNKITYSNLAIGVVPKSSTAILGINEFPVENLVLNIPEQSDTIYYRTLNSAIYVSNKTTDDIDVTAEFTVFPIVSYQQTGKIRDVDAVYKNINIAPTSLQFKNGVLCISNTFSPSIATDDGAHIPIPVAIDVTADKSQINNFESVKVTAKLISTDGTPVKGAKVNFKIDNSADLASTTWLGSDSQEISSYTNLMGSADATLVTTQTKFGWFVQKQWVHDNIIDLPFDILNYDAKHIYLYIVTADDPILGKINANLKEQAVYDYYSTDRFDSYGISGRKVAYVSMNTTRMSNKTVLQSSFIKPQTVFTSNNVQFDIKNAFIIDKKDEGVSLFDTELTAGSPTYRTISGWDGSWSVYGGTNYGYKTYTAPVATRVVYNNIIPGQLSDNIVGYWLVAGSGGSVDVSASFEASDYNINLQSDTKTITIINYVKSEHEFIIADHDLLNMNTAMGSFGYYTVSEYLDNAYGKNACSYGCIYSDPTLSTDNKCIHKNVAYHRFYTGGNPNTGCILTPEYYDALLTPSDQRCPGLDAHVVNPYILHAQKN